MTDLPGQMHFIGQAIVQVGKCNPVLSSHWLSNNDLVNIIEFIPIFIMEVDISHQRFKFRSSGNGNIQRLCSKECLKVKQVKVVVIYKIGQKLVSQSIEGWHYGKCYVPSSVGRAVDHSNKNKNDILSIHVCCEDTEFFPFSQGYILFKESITTIWQELYWKISVTVRLLEPGHLEEDYPITMFFANKRFSRTNDIHKFDGCFLRSQVSSNGFKFFISCIVEPWILLVHLQEKLENLVFKGHCDWTKSPGSRSRRSRSVKRSIFHKKIWISTLTPLCKLNSNGNGKVLLLAKKDHLHLLRTKKRIVIIKPFINTWIFFWVQLNLDRFQRFNIQDIVCIIQRRFLIIKRRKSHSLKMPSVSLFSSHHDPHGAKTG